MSHIERTPEFEVYSSNVKLKLILTICILLFAGMGWYYYEYHYSVSGEVPLLVGDSSPTRIRPEGKEASSVNHLDKMLYNNFKDASKNSNIAVTVAPEPEKPIPLAQQNTVQDQFNDDPIARIITDVQDPTHRDATSHHSLNIKILGQDGGARDVVGDNARRSSAAYRVQLLSTRDYDHAEQEWEKLKKSHYKALHEVSHDIERSATKSGGVIYTLLVGEFSTFSHAKALCKKLSTSSQHCVVVKVGS